MGDAKNKYDFEELQSPLSSNDEETLKDANIFFRRLGLGNNFAKQSDHIQQLVLEFVANVHRNIDWYVKKQNQQKRLRRFYFGSSIALVIAIPLITFYIPQMPLTTEMKELPPSAIISSQLTALLTGIYSIHRIFTAWLFRRNSAHAFWKAGSSLKSILYTFEDRWRNQAFTNLQYNPLFMKDLIQGKLDAKKIVNEERESFFSSLNNASIDLQNITTTSATAANSMKDRISVPILKALEATEQDNVKTVLDIQKSYKELIKSFATRKFLNESLLRLKSHVRIIQNKTQKQALQTRINAEEKKLAEVEMELLTNRANYHAERAKLPG